MPLSDLRRRRWFLPIQSRDGGRKDDDDDTVLVSAPEMDPRSDSDSDSEADRVDSGYNSASDSEAELYQQKTAQYAAEGPVKANYGPRTIELVDMELTL